MNKAYCGSPSGTHGCPYPSSKTLIKGAWMSPSMNDFTQDLNQRSHECRPWWMISHNFELGPSLNWMHIHIVWVVIDEGYSSANVPLTMYNNILTSWTITSSRLPSNFRIHQYLNGGLKISIHRWISIYRILDSIVSVNVAKNDHKKWVKNFDLWAHHSRGLGWPMGLRSFWAR